MLRFLCDLSDNETTLFERAFFKYILEKLVFLCPQDSRVHVALQALLLRSAISVGHVL